MKLKFRFSILMIMALTMVIAHTGAKRHVASRLATSAGTVHSTWIPFVIEVCVPEQMGIPFDKPGISATAITKRRYVGLGGLYIMMSSQLDFSKPIQLNGYHVYNQSSNSALTVSSP